jgi:N-acetylmuramoyl-L-alanine amidase
MARRTRVPAFAVALALALAVQLGAVPAYADTPADVCLDPGHGGTDPGAVREWNGVTLREKEMNLYIAEQVKLKLEGNGYTVKLTRTDNATTLGNSARAEICNSVGAKVVLSIHLNASTNDQADYFRVFYGKKLKDEAFARMIDQHYAIGDPLDPAKLLTHASVTNFANGTLLKSKAPAALSEGLFMSHWKEKELLASNYPKSARADAVATELHKGLVAWLKGS